MEARKEEQRGVARFLVAKGAATRHKVKTTCNAVGRNHLFCMITPVPKLPIWWGISFRDRLGNTSISSVQPRPFSLWLLHFWRPVKDIRGRRFHSDEEVQVWVRLRIHQGPTSFYKTGIDHLVSQWDKCINTCGNYFWIKQFPLIIFSGCSVFIWLPLVTYLVFAFNSFLVFIFSSRLSHNLWF